MLYLGNRDEGVLHNIAQRGTHYTVHTLCPRALLCELIIITCDSPRSGRKLGFPISYFHNDKLYYEKLYYDKLYSDKLYNDKLYNDKHYNGKHYNDKHYNDKHYNDKHYNDKHYNYKLYNYILHSDTNNYLSLWKADSTKKSSIMRRHYLD